MNLQLFLTLHPADLGQSSNCLPTLEQLLAVAKLEKQEAILEPELCQMFGVTAQTDWPSAAISWLGEGEAVSGFYWLHAHPVSLLLQRDYFALAHPVPLDLHTNEAEALRQALNQHFEADGLQFVLSPAGRWYVRLDKAPQVQTAWPAKAIGRDIRPFMPQGPEAGRWLQLVNEIQMLLHEHPVNQAREAAGELPVNSIWFAGGGVLPAKPQSEVMTIFACNPLARGLAKLADLPGFDLPASFDDISAEAGENILLVLDDARSAERDWFKPLADALRRGRIKRLSLKVAGYDMLLSATLRPSDLWKFWRKPAKLQNYFNG
ncbi:MAG TPA: hypothetical protein VFF74_01705 [Methylophilaceae bacterium]|nr:hypothetical protein [Methylophilaceae bacterium]